MCDGVSRCSLWFGSFPLCFIVLGVCCQDRWALTLALYCSSPPLSLPPSIISFSSTVEKEKCFKCRQMLKTRLRSSTSHRLQGRLSGFSRRRWVDEGKMKEAHFPNDVTVALQAAEQGAIKRKRRFLLLISSSHGRKHETHITLRALCPPMYLLDFGDFSLLLLHPSPSWLSCEGVRAEESVKLSKSD